MTRANEYLPTDRTPILLGDLGYDRENVSSANGGPAPLRESRG